MASRNVGCSQATSASFTISRQLWTILVIVDHHLRNKMCRAWCLHCSWDKSGWRGHSWHHYLLCSRGICTVVLSSAGIWPRNSWRRIHLFFALLLIHVGYYLLKWDPWCFSEPLSGTLTHKILRAGLFKAVLRNPRTSSNGCNIAPTLQRCIALKKNCRCE